LHLDWPWPKGFDGTPPPTRPEEYDFVLREAEHFKKRVNALDAASGWRPDWHIFAENLVRTYQIPTIAMDLNPEHLWRFDYCPNLIRMLGDICGMPFADESFDIVFCISTLEHLPTTAASRAFYELTRVCRHHLVLTFDGDQLDAATTMLENYGFTAGKRQDQEGPLLVTEKGKPVCYVIANRLD
jgi:ubiquinone/menaquinone biosynthesis C-methylase UbiE